MNTSATKYFQFFSIGGPRRNKQKKCFQHFAGQPIYFPWDQELGNLTSVKVNQVVHALRASNLVNFMLDFPIVKRVKVHQNTDFQINYIFS